MRPDDLRGGSATTIEVRAIGVRFDPVPVRREDVQLSRLDDEIVLRFRDHVWPVVAADPRQQESLAEAAGHGAETVAWTAQADGARAVIQVQKFASALRFEDPLAIGVDDRCVEDLRLRFGVGGTVIDLARWLEERLLLPVAGLPYRRGVISPETRASDDAFRMFGKGVSIDVRRHDGRLRIHRVLKEPPRHEAPVRLLCAPLSFADVSSTGEIAAGARHALEDAVRSATSYLHMWSTYAQMERETILRRARLLGALPYERWERRKDGTHRFHLAAADDLEERLRALSADERIELEAGSSPPSWDGLDQEVRRARKVPRLVAPVARVDALGRTLDLRPQEDDEDQPSPPAVGFLYRSLAGNRVSLRRREVAEEKLRTGNCPMPQLGLLLEGRPALQVSYRRRSPKSDAVAAAFGGRPTRRQMEALDVALNTPDIALIQGPPGTGKTKVITALQRRIAELADEGAEVAHRILVTSAQHDAVENVVERSEVFGLPAVKVGTKRGDEGAAIDGVARFRADRAERLHATLKELPDVERAARAHRIALSCLRAPSPPAETAARLRELADIVEGLVTPALRDRLWERAGDLARPAGPSGDSEEHELRVQAAWGIRVQSAAFEDDGPAKARKAILRLGDFLLPPERDFLRQSADWTDPTAPPWLTQGAPLRDAILNRLTAPAPPVQATADEATRSLLIAIVDEIALRRRLAAVGEQAVLVGYLEDLENDPGAVREALEHYTVVLGATLQQAMGGAMRSVRGIDTGSVQFETVIVDEAARANPLDLFIPMSMAKRRVVLVGDHRQLPHMLEPDVEREIAAAVEKGDLAREAEAALKASLFKRLWHLLRQLQDQDNIQRTVTLDVQFRMHPVLGDFVSRMFYERHGDDKIESGGKPEEFAHALLEYQKNGQPCVAAWVDVPGGPGRWERRGRSKSREVEARRVAIEVRRLLEADPQLTFGVIAFYAAQVDAIGEALVQEGVTERTDSGGWRIAERWRRTVDRRGELVERLRFGTVDAFQGKEFDVVFLSVTRSNDLPGETDEQRRCKYGHIMLDNRLCVAMSRQHRLLIAVGDRAFVRAEAALVPLRELSTLCEGPHGIVRV